MASNNPKRQPQQFNHQANKFSSVQMVQPNHKAIALHRKLTLARFWNHQRQQMAKTKHNFKKHEFPLSRIKKIMRGDTDVEMVATEAPILLAKAAEFFIQELTIKSWVEAEHAGRRTLRKDDILEVINHETNYYDFLFDLLDKQAAGVIGSSSMVSSHADPVASSSIQNATIENGVPVLTPAVQRWIRYGDENGMNGGEQSNDAAN